MAANKNFKMELIEWFSVKLKSLRALATTNSILEIRVPNLATFLVTPTLTDVLVIASSQQ
jgi:hypothetical protein